MIDNYFSRKEVSNSDLSSVKKLLYGDGYINYSQDALLFGSIVDSLITEPENINIYSGLYNGVEVPLHVFQRAKKCAKAFNESQYKHFLLDAEFQKVSIANRLFNWNGIDFKLDCRCKWDFFGPNISGDLKTTVATNQKQFIDTCHQFDYFRQRAWYMDIEQTNRDLLIGISKTNYKVFHILIERGDENYNLGKSQYTELAFKYWMLNGII